MITSARSSTATSPFAAVALGPAAASRRARAPACSSSISELRTVRYDSATAVSGCSTTTIRRRLRRTQNGNFTTSAMTGSPKCSSASRRLRMRVSERSSSRASAKPRMAATTPATSIRWARDLVPRKRSCLAPRSGASMVV